MFDKIVKYIPFTTVAVIYLYICGSLYLIGFWSTFKIDISNIVSLGEIPKSFIFPFVITHGFFFIYSLFEYMTPIAKPEDIEKFKKIKWWFIQPAFFILICGILSAFLLIFSDSIILWVVAGFFFVLGLNLYLVNSGIVSEVIPSYIIRRYIVTMIVITPVSSFILGKAASLQIFKNERIKIIKTITSKDNSKISVITDSCCLKLLGFLGDKLIIADLDNTHVIIINQSSYDGVDIGEDKRK